MEKFLEMEVLRFIFRILLFLMSIVFFSSDGLWASSLWMASSNSERNILSDKIACRVGDLLTITIKESNGTTTKSNTTTKKDPVSIDNTVTAFFYPSSASNFGKHNGSLPRTSITGKNEYTGDGAITNTNEMNGTVTVKVIDVLPNETLVIEGRRLIGASSEKQYAVLTGLIRQEDIAFDNTIESTKIADARVEYLQEGVVNSAQKKGWLLRLNDWLNPF